MYTPLQDPILPGFKKVLGSYSRVFVLYALIFAILLHIIKAINNCFDTILRPFACILKREIRVIKLSLLTKIV